MLEEVDNYLFTHQFVLLNSISFKEWGRETLNFFFFFLKGYNQSRFLAYKSFLKKEKKKKRKKRRAAAKWICSLKRYSLASCQRLVLLPQK